MSFRGLAALYVSVYLAAIVAANLTLTWLKDTPLGKSATVLIAFLFIGLDLTSRDVLHEAWRGRALVWKMGALIVAGSALSWALNHGAGQIALASFVAFASAGVSDSVVYGLLGRRARLLRVNGSNVVSAAVDSLVFPTLAFGQLLPLVIAGQFAAKVLGGGVWSVLLFGIGRPADRVASAGEP